MSVSPVRLGVIIAAAGSSDRYMAAGGVRPKLEEDILGKTVLRRATEILASHPLAQVTIVAGPHEAEAFEEFRQRHGGVLGFLGASLCRGGKNARGESVRAALELIDPSCTHIAVHDAARPCATPELIDRLLEMAAHHEAVIPVVEINDTLKRVRETDKPALPVDRAAKILGVAGKGPGLRVVDSTLDRAGVFAAQTPQVFRADVLQRAWASADPKTTDDAGAVEALGVPVACVSGEATNIKVTRPADLQLARAIVALREGRGQDRGWGA